MIRRMLTRTLHPLLALAQGDGAPLGQPAPTSNVALSATIAAGAVFFGVLLVGYWYQRMLKDRKGRPRAETKALADDLVELTERLANELDRKAERVEALLSAADERIRQLERLQLETPRGSFEGRLVEPRPRVRHETTGAESVGSHREVYDLADQGLSPLEIAQRLDRPTGQIELILNLRRGTVAL
jgi:hypothetical protein